jgi:hypothetical protein
MASLLSADLAAGDANAVDVRKLSAVDLTVGLQASTLAASSSYRSPRVIK